MRNKILIVDDSLFNRQVLKDILKGKYELEEASDGQEALELIEEQKNEDLRERVWVSARRESTG